MFGAEPTPGWWRRPVTLAAAAGVVAGVVIGGASHSLPASSTRPIERAAPAVRRVTVTVTVAAPTVTLTHIHTVPVLVAPSDRPAPTPTVGFRPGNGAPASSVLVRSSPLPSPSGGSSSAGSQSASGSTEPTGPVTPVSSEPPVFGPGPAVQCKDGTLSYADHPQSGCAHHGGVAHWYR